MKKTACLLKGGAAVLSSLARHGGKGVKVAGQIKKADNGNSYLPNY